MNYQIYTFEQLDTQLLYEILQHRFEVFVMEQQNIYHDLDDFDQKAFHLIAYDEDHKIQGYVRLLPSKLHYDGYEENSFGRLSVKKEARKNGVGGELVRRACRYLAETGECTAVRISAMAYLENFYTRLGFSRVSEVFKKEGVPHVTMLYTV